MRLGRIGKVMKKELKKGKLIILILVVVCALMLIHVNTPGFIPWISTVDAVGLQYHFGSTPEKRELQKTLRQCAADSKILLYSTARKQGYVYERFGGNFFFADLRPISIFPEAVQIGFLVYVPSDSEKAKKALQDYETMKLYTENWSNLWER